MREIGQKSVDRLPKAQQAFAASVAVSGFVVEAIRDNKSRRTAGPPIDSEPSAST
jgi:hypothetical protein